MDIELTGLEKAINQVLAEYGDEASEVVAEVCEEEIKNGVKLLKQKSPKKTGEYAKGWRVKKSKDKHGARFIIYNAKKPQLTHLLEKRHAKKNGKGFVDGTPHIYPVQQEIEKNAVEKIEKRLSK